MKNKIDVKAGDRFKGPHGEIRIMAVAENYALARHKGCVPFARHFREFMNYERVQK